MAAYQLTNLVPNGSFEANVTSWSGFSTSNQGAQSNLTPTRVAKPASPTHSEFGSWVLNVGAKTQGVVAARPTAFIPTIIGHKYYIRARVRLRGSNPVGVVSQLVVAHHINPAGAAVALPGKGASLQPLAICEGLYSTDIIDFVLIDDIWTADRTQLAPAIVGAKTSNGNDDQYIQIDNVVIVDLTADVGAGSEPPLFVIRGGVNNYTSPTNGGNGWWEGSANVDLPIPPEFDTTSTTALGLRGRPFSYQIDRVAGTGTGPFIFSITGLPAGHGLEINNNGLISGTLQLAEGTYSFTIRLVDSVGYDVSQEYTLNVGEPPVIVETFLPGAILGQPYAFTPTVEGSEPLTVTVSVLTGSLPAGLSISGDTITGTPTIDNQSCQIIVTAENEFDTVSRAFTLTVSSMPNIGTSSPLPNAILNAAGQGIPYSTTILSSGAAPITYSVISGSLPGGLSLSSSGVISGTPASTGTSSFTVQAENSLGADTRVFTLSVYQPPAVTTVTLGYARLGTPYSAQLTASGSQPITYQLTSGGLPVGLSLAGTTGLITGTPTAAGTYSFTVTATNIAGVSVAVPLTITAGMALAIATQASLPAGTVGQPYTPLQFTALGIDTDSSVAWSWGVSGRPPGLSFTTAGVLSGTLTTAGTYSFDVTITNGSAVATTTCTLEAGQVPTLSGSDVLYGTISRPYTAVLSADGLQPITYRMSSGPTPQADITLDSNGVITWLVPTPGPYVFYVIATNRFGDSVAGMYTLTITSPSITDVDLPAGIVGVPYIKNSGDDGYTFTPDGMGPFTWEHISGTLPPGLSFDPVPGKITGSPTTAGTFDFGLRLYGIAGQVQEDFRIVVNVRPAITTVALNSGNVLAAYSQTLTASGTTPITWSHSGSLPPGLTRTGATISGTPTTEGVYTFNVTASNVTGSAYADTAQFTIVIGPSGAPVITTTSSLSAVVGQPFTRTLTATGNPPIGWSLDVGSSLPDGLALAGDVVSGTPTTSGTYTFTLWAKNGIGSGDSREFTLRITETPTITSSPSLISGVVGQPYAQQLTATGDPAPTWAAVTPVAPEVVLASIGLSVNAVTGILSGAPTVPGTHTFRIQATNSAGSDIILFTLTVLPPGGPIIDGKEVESFFIDGREVEAFFVDGNTYEI